MAMSQSGVSRLGGLTILTNVWGSLLLNRADHSKVQPTASYIEEHGDGKQSLRYSWLTPWRGKMLVTRPSVNYSTGT